MAEEEKNKKCTQDLRIFGIALLTAVIVVALYHFGLGLCRIYCSPCNQGPCPLDRPMPQPVYVLVPAGEFNGGPCAMRSHHKGFRRCEFRQDQAMKARHAGKERREWDPHRRKGEGPCPFMEPCPQRENEPSQENPAETPAPEEK